MIKVVGDVKADVHFHWAHVTFRCTCPAITHWYAYDNNEPRREKICLRVSDQVRHKPGCAATEGS